MSYVQIALDYYVLARQGYWSGFLPVGPNLFLHAFEMLFKAQLVEAGTPQEDIKKSYGHRLMKLWPAFKATAKGIPGGPAPQLDPFDALIQQLDAWEDIRYPAFPGGRGVAIRGSLRKGDVNQRVGGSVGSQASDYVINLEAMDEPFAAACTVQMHLHSKPPRCSPRRAGIL